MTPTTSVSEIDEMLRTEAPTTEAKPATPTTPKAITVAASNLKLQRRLTLAITVIPFLTFLLGLRFLWGGISGLDITLLVGLYSLSILGVTVGFHRMLTHGAFDAPAPIRVALAIAGSMAVEGSVIGWVADHRRHHMYTDKEGDPHSPHLVDGTGLKATLLGLWHAHIGWFFDHERTRIERFAPDLQKDRGLRIVSALFPLWTVLSLALAPAIALAVTHSMHSALTALVWGSLVRVFLLHHVTWSINSICHFYGRRPYLPDGRLQHQQLDHVARVLRRGLAQQPPRLPQLGVSRPAVVAGGSQWPGDPSDARPPPGPQRPLPVTRAAPAQGLRAGELTPTPGPTWANGRTEAGR